MAAIAAWDALMLIALECAEKLYLSSLSQRHWDAIDASFNSGSQIRTLESIMGSEAPGAFCDLEL
jgi:hypothetical protein